MMSHNIWRTNACKNLLIRAGWQEFANWNVAACFQVELDRKLSRLSPFRISPPLRQKCVPYYGATSGAIYCTSDLSGDIAIECKILPFKHCICTHKSRCFYRHSNISIDRRKKKTKITKNQKEYHFKRAYSQYYYTKRLLSDLQIRFLPLILFFILQFEVNKPEISHPGFIVRDIR